MQLSEAYQYIQQSQRRKVVLTAMTQPMTANQLARRTNLSRADCSQVQAELVIHNLVSCLNPLARRSRLYWLTDLGQRVRRRLCSDRSRASTLQIVSTIDWALYGQMCFTHRAAVVRALNEPLQPAAIKRRARVRQPQLRISANNVRDIIRLLAAWGVVRPVQVRRKAHARYELTDTGKAIQQLLDRAEVPL